jgi:epoxyqueuosine reductase
MPELAHESTEKSSAWPLAEIEEAMRGHRRQQNLRDCWRKPLVGIAAVNDPLFAQLETAVAPDHAQPSDLLPGARSVIVYFLPFQRFLGEENDRNGFYASRSWAEAYVVTNQLIAVINTHLQERLKEAGYAAQTTPATHNFDEQKLISRWSHKHLAYIAGLGTFGHHHLLITPAGCCGRLGSLVTDMPLTPSPRPDRQYCLNKAGRRCHACVAKCKYGALRRTDFDRHSCYAHLLRNNDHFSDMPLVDVCGKCACEVPCSYEKPGKQ